MPMREVWSFIFHNEFWKQRKPMWMFITFPSLIHSIFFCRLCSTSHKFKLFLNVNTVAGKMVDIFLSTRSHFCEDKSFPSFSFLMTFFTGNRWVSRGNEKWAGKNFTFWISAKADFLHGTWIFASNEIFYPYILFTFS